MDAISLHDYVFEQLLDKHKPEYTKADEMLLRQSILDIANERMNGETWENLNLTVLVARTCACGTHIGSFDEYRRHLSNVMMEAQP